MLFKIGEEVAKGAIVMFLHNFNAVNEFAHCPDLLAIIIKGLLQELEIFVLTCCGLGDDALIDFNGCGFPAFPFLVFASDEEQHNRAENHQRKEEQDGDAKL